METPPKKAEYMTSLSGNNLVCKTHGRIAFRGIIDTLEAEVIEAQVLASREGADDICASLGEVLGCLRALMSAEVRDAPLPPPMLFGMSAEEIRRQSHCAAGGGNLKLPAHTQGAVAARLNYLRAKTREAELAAARVFAPAAAEAAGTAAREDIILALNRLSSALWWLFCEYTAG